MAFLVSLVAPPLLIITLPWLIVETIHAKRRFQRERREFRAAVDAKAQRAYRADIERRANLFGGS
jgi:hypothetical protein